MAYNISEEERKRRSERMRQMQEARANRPPPISPPDVNVRRFGLADMEPMGMWLFERLVKHFPHLTDRIFSGWVRSLMNSNDMLFLRTNDAVCLAQLSRWPLDPVPYLEEVFVLCRNDALEEGAALYSAMYSWAKGAGATEMVVDRFSDVPRDMIVKAIGKVTDYDLAIVRVG